MKRNGSKTSAAAGKSALLAVLVLIAAMVTAVPAAAIGLTFQPSAQDVGLGNTAVVDVVASGLEAGGLDEVVSAYDIFVTFDPAILSVSGVSFSTLLDDPADPVNGAAVTGYDDSLAGTLELYALSWASDAFLQGTQPDTFTLATISFDSLAVGISPLSFVYGPSFQFQDVKGVVVGVLPITQVDNGFITVTGTAVPEPGTLLLLGSGLLGLVGTGLKRRRG